MVLRRCGKPNAIQNEVLNTVLVTHRERDGLCKVHFLPYGPDKYRPQEKVNERRCILKFSTAVNISSDTAWST